MCWLYYLVAIHCCSTPQMHLQKGKELYRSKERVSFLNSLNERKIIQVSADSHFKPLKSAEWLDVNSAKKLVCRLQ